MKEKSDIAIIGLAVMGENLALNMESKGYTVSVFNRHTERVTAFLSSRGQDKDIRGADSLEDLTAQLEHPRKVMLMIKAGAPVDEMIEQLIPLLESGDLIIDGGNSNYQDTERRTKQVEEQGFLYIGCGVSGGEEGALHGPSMMPGGSEAAWPLVKPLFQAIAAHTDDGAPCCEWIGSGGAGHFVKMVHNGIEYGDMQLIAEVYQIMKFGLGLDNAAMAETFAAWNEGKLESYLIEITRDILRYKDQDGRYPLDYILDKAGQKGTGKWTGQEALEEGVPLTLVVEAVLARSLSAMKETRLLASQTYGQPDHSVPQDSLSLQDLEDALYASKIISYAQGFMLMRQSAQTHGWKLNFGEIATLWRGGCIIRSVFLGRIKEAFDANPGLENLLIAPYFVQAIKRALPGWRRVAATAQLHGISVPCISSALAFFDGFTSDRLPANLLQAQRDYFGAHTYERTDRPAGEYFHTNWTGEGGSTASTVYQK